MSGLAAIGLVLNHGRLHGIEETKIHIDAGAGPRIDLHSLLGPGFRGQDPEFASPHRSYSSPRNTYSDAGTTHNSIRQQAGDNDTCSDADPNPAPDAAPDCRANSD